LNIDISLINFQRIVEVQQAQDCGRQINNKQIGTQPKLIQLPQSQTGYFSGEKHTLTAAEYCE